MNKTHWNTVELDGTVPPKMLLSWIDDSYELVLNSIPVSKRVLKKK
jgi:predicted DNA-binding protein (MmcQ/YjbR family)